MVGCKKETPIVTYVDGVFIHQLAVNIEGDLPVYKYEIENLASEDMIKVDLKMYFDIKQDHRKENVVNNSFVTIFSPDQDVTIKSGESLEFEFSFPQEIMLRDQYEHDDVNLQMSGYFGIESDLRRFSMSGSVDGFGLDQ